MKNNEKNIFVIRIFLIFIAIGILTIFNYLIDPFQQYRVPKFYTLANYRENERALNSGLIKNSDYDSVIIGSSMTRNFDTNYLNELLEWKSLKLTMSGASQKDIKKTLDFVNKNRKINNILLGIDIGTFFQNANYERVTFPEYMYDKNSLKNNIKYLWNLTVLKESMKIIKMNFLDKKSIEKTFPLGYRYTYSKEEVLKNQKGEILNHNYSLNNPDKNIIKNMENNYKENLKKILEENKDKKIVVFFPPYSILYYDELIINNQIKEYIFFKKYLIMELLKYKNVEIFDFQDIKKIIFNLDNYGDKMHFSPEASQKLLKFISLNQEKINNEKEMNEKIESLIEESKNIKGNI
ncbi:hypothetical protein [uncultured Fusobacterium sp.]|uniref:hypothetical protein n=1 Tax=uncultured Fusobacterium sp. TaxID=159267 RepID=UPI0025E80560|nr:hypothetical protein [uncultured Fusobacterium sp.]